MIPHSTSRVLSHYHNNISIILYMICFLPIGFQQARAQPAAIQSSPTMSKEQQEYHKNQGEDDAAGEDEDIDEKLFQLIKERAEARREKERRERIAVELKDPSQLKLLQAPPEPGQMRSIPFWAKQLATVTAVTAPLAMIFYASHRFDANVQREINGLREKLSSHSLQEADFIKASKIGYPSYSPTILAKMIEKRKISLGNEHLATIDKELAKKGYGPTYVAHILDQSFMPTDDALKHINEVLAKRYKDYKKIRSEANAAIRWQKIRSVFNPFMRLFSAASELAFSK